ncbi:hypothetical protein SADUNF_Sadunf08G0158900 [Salix dunnii]|uniref:Uncharacterized protein n=1 Tax=Salix dunnii TaxID=1413687 RepID=A0A835JZ14_9ROSI|nr:hypothetical protein SADUNF_Sadunf08G0158900 [Salix dunnii]
MAYHIHVKETSILCYGPPCFTKDKQLENETTLSKETTILIRVRNNHLRNVLSYPERYVFPLKTLFIKTLVNLLQLYLRSMKSQKESLLGNSNNRNKKYRKQILTTTRLTVQWHKPIVFTLKDEE